ncbi:MAG: hypothetical protein ROZ36_17325 [Thermincola sp.]|nr:hypothetical protein [Thermincola sp.]
MKSALASIFTVFLLQISSWLPFSKKFSIFYHMSGPGIYSGHGFPYITLVVLAAISAPLYYLGRTRFVSRDF